MKKRLRFWLFVALLPAIVFVFYAYTTQGSGPLVYPGCLGQKYIIWNPGPGVNSGGPCIGGDGQLFRLGHNQALVDVADGLLIVIVASNVYLIATDPSKLAAVRRKNKSPRRKA